MPARIWIQLTTWMVVVVLTTSAIAKTFAPEILLFSLHDTFGWYVPRFVVGVLIALEFLIAAWLVSGRHASRALLTATLLFLSFSAYHLTNFLGPDPRSCGCMGSLWMSFVDPGVRRFVEAGLALIPTWFLINAILLMRRNALTRSQLGA